MAVSYSNYLKAILFPGINESNVSKENSLTVQQFSYTVARSRNDAGFPYGTTLPTEISFTLRLLEPNDAKLYYSRLTDNSSYVYTFFFNVTFNAYKRLADYEDALVVEGYVVDVEDSFNTTPSSNGTTDQMLIKVKLLVNSITYRGKENDKKLIINNR